MYIFIINPTAGNGRAKRIYEKLLHDSIYRELNPRYYFTKYSGHAEVIVEQISDEIDGQPVKGIVVIGGDGTLHEVVNGLHLRHLPISFIPAGSGNDFARGMKLSKSPEATLKAIRNNGRTVDYWLGEFVASGFQNRRFINCIGFGFDAVVAASANKSRYKKLFNQFFLGSVIYILSLLKQLFFYKPISITVTLDGKEKTFSRCLFFIVNNHPYIGGGMKVNPHAVNNEDTYSIIVVDSISKWKVLALFGTVFSGRHLRFKGVSTFEARDITLKSSTKQPVPMQVDGETSSATYCRIQKPNKPISLQVAEINKLSKLDK